MIGCVAKATSDELHVDISEMEEVRWITREQVAQAVQRSSDSDLMTAGREILSWDPGCVIVERCIMCRCHKPGWHGVHMLWHAGGLCC